MLQSEGAEGAKLLGTRPEKYARQSDSSYERSRPELLVEHRLKLIPPLSAASAPLG